VSVFQQSGAPSAYCLIIVVRENMSVAFSWIITQNFYNQ